MNNNPRKNIESGISAVLTGIVINIILCIIKAVAGIVGHSYALIADAIESGGDICTSIVLFFGLKTAAREPDLNHPYGHGKAEPAAAIMVSVVLWLSALIIIYESVKHILIPHKTPHPFTLIVLAGVIIVKEILFRFVIKKSNESKSNALKGEAIHHRSDAFTSLAAFIGISIAVIGGPGYETADDWAALLAAIFISYNALHVFKPAFSELMDEAQPAELIEEIKKIAMQVYGVKGSDQCYVRKMGFDYFVDIHIIVDGKISVQAGHDIAHHVKNEIMNQKKFVTDVLTHVEPDDEFHQISPPTPLPR